MTRAASVHAASVIGATMLALFASTASAQPAITRPVTDEAAVLSPLALDATEIRLRRHRDGGHAQIAVLIVRTTSGVPIADYANAAASAWGGGSAADDGVLFVLAVDDHEMRIEVGYGLEDRIPDSVAMHILDDIAPRLRAGDYDGAVADVVTALIGRTGAVTSAPAPPRQAAPRLEPRTERGSGWACALLGLAVLSVPLLVVFMIWKDGNLATYGADGAHAYHRFVSDRASSSSSSTGSSSRSSWGSSSRSSSWGSSSHEPSSSSSHKPSSSWGSSSHKPSSSSHKPSSSSHKSYSGGGGKFGGGGASKRW